MINDETLKKQVVDILYLDDRIDALNIMVDVKDSVVILSGNVPSIRAKRMAGDIVSNLKNVVSVDNKLDIKYPLTIPKKEQIIEDVNNVLLLDPDLKSWKIDVEVDKGIVTLKGTVDAYWKKLLAEQKVEDTFGVIGVKNELAIVQTKKITDENIAKNIIKSMENNFYVNEESINVNVKNGEVVLTGEAPSEFIRLATHNCALYSPGVKVVKNGIKLRR